jgi:hypothetical protein
MSAPGEAVISIDGVEKKRGSNQTDFSVVDLKQGAHVVRVVFTPTDSSKPAVPFEKSIDIGPRINNVSIAVF